MPADSVRSLIGLAADVREPNAYQVFGLTEGDQDSHRIQQAIRATVEQLKSVRSKTDATVWNQAAHLVQQSRTILTDPAKKSELDAQFGIIGVSTDDDSWDDGTSAPSPSLNSVLPSHDPLSGLLPTMNPLAVTANMPGTSIPQVPIGVQPTAVFQPVEYSAQVPANTQETAPVFVGPKLSAKSTAKRRRRSVWPMLLMGTLVVGLLASVVGIVFWVPKMGQLTVQTGNGRIQFSAGPQQQTGPEPVTQAGAPGAKGSRGARDPIIGSLEPGREKDRSLSIDLNQSLPEGPSGLEASMNLDVGEGAPPMMNEGPTETMVKESTPSEPTLSPAITPEPSAATSPEPAPPIPTTPPSEDQIKAGEASIEQAKQSLARANWSQMKTISEKAVASAVTGEQKELAEGLFELADLADFYRVGIEQAIAGLEVGGTFEYVPGVTVNVVETGPDKLTIRVNGQNKRYTFNTLPLTLAHRLAAFKVTPDGTGIAAKCAYQAVAPNSTDEHRTAAIKWLSEITEPIEGIDPERMIKTIERVFQTGS